MPSLITEQKSARGLQFVSRGGDPCLGDVLPSRRDVLPHVRSSKPGEIFGTCEARPSKCLTAMAATVIAVMALLARDCFAAQRESARSADRRANCPDRVELSSP